MNHEDTREALTNTEHQLKAALRNMEIKLHNMEAAAQRYKRQLETLREDMAAAINKSF